MNYVTAPAKVIYKALATNGRLTETWTEDCMAADREHAYHTFNFGPVDTVIFRVEALIPTKKWSGCVFNPIRIGKARSSPLNCRTWRARAPLPDGITEGKRSKRTLIIAAAIGLSFCTA